MSDKYENEQNDPLKDYYREIARGMNPPSHLVSRVKGEVTVKLLPKSVHVKRFVQAALCYVIGVALLLSAVILLPKLWERGEPIATLPSETEGTTDAPQYDVPLSSLYEGEIVTKVEFTDLYFAPTDFYTTDLEMIDALQEELEQINAALGSYNRYMTYSSFIVLHFEHGGYAQYAFAQDGDWVNYTVYDSLGNQTNRMGVKLSDVDRARVDSFVGSQVEALVPIMDIPDPNEYLDGEITEAILRREYEHSGDNRILGDVQIADIVKEFTAILKGLPLDTQPCVLDRDYYEVELMFGNNGWVRIYLYPQQSLILVKLNLKESAQNNTYCFRIPEVNARECAFWLERYYRGESVSEFPSLEYYLNERTSRFFGLYDSVDSEQWAYISQSAAVAEQFYQFVRNLNFTLVSEDIPSDEPMPNGKKIAITTSINGDELVLELDSSGKVNCRLLDGYRKRPLYAAQYAFSAEDYAELTAYVDRLLNADA